MPVGAVMFTGVAVCTRGACAITAGGTGTVCVGTNGVCIGAGVGGATSAMRGTMNAAIASATCTVIDTGQNDQRMMISFHAASAIAALKV